MCYNTNAYCTFKPNANVLIPFTNGVETILLLEESKLLTKKIFGSSEL